MDSNSAIYIKFDVLDTDIFNLKMLKEQSTEAIKNKYDEIKSVFAASDSLMAEQLYASADLLYSVDAIMNDMINQTIITMQYVKTVFQNTDINIAVKMGGEYGKRLYGRS